MHNLPTVLFTFSPQNFPFVYIFIFPQQLLRGHTHECYKLKPGISRGIHCADVIEKAEREISERFKDEITVAEKTKHFNFPNNDQFSFACEWELYFQAQHCRLLTRLIDWTISWDTAVSFAIGTDLRTDDIDGAVWILNSDGQNMKATSDENDYKNVSPFALADSLILYPPIIYAESENYAEKLSANRQLSQGGKFTIQAYEKSVIPMEEQLALEDCLEKIIIPSKLKKQVRNYGYPFRLTEDELYSKEYFGIDEIAAKINSEFSEKLKGPHL